MQRLKSFIDRERRRAPAPALQDLANRVREYLQVMVLKSIFGETPGGALSFIGGTCLRMCYDLKRYSEDLDFNLDGRQGPSDFTRSMRHVQRALQLEGIACDVAIDTKRAVHQCYLKFEGLPFALGLSPRRNEKLHLKVEVDTHPVRASKAQRESFFIARCDEVFPIIKHRNETLFAGKLIAIMSRPYAKGRDYYDLIWYLREGIAVDLDYLNAGLLQTAELRSEPKPAPIDSEAALFSRIEPLVKAVDVKAILKDVGRFLEDATEVEWLKEYARLFHQLVSRRGKTSLDVHN